MLSIDKQATWEGQGMQVIHQHDEISMMMSQVWSDLRSCKMQRMFLTSL